MIDFIIVDDEKYTCLMLSEIMDWKSMGFNLCGIFYNGQTALDFIKENHVDIVITDINMPKMNGLELAKELNSLSPETYIIFISAYRDFEYARAALSLNVKDYIVKPIVYEQFENTINKAKEHFSPVQNSHNEIINKALDFIDKHYMEFITLESISAHISMNPGYFSTYFKNQTGEKFIDYLVRIRMEKAMALIEKNPDIKSFALCDSVGYKSVPYFYKIFRSFTGMTPAEYKEKILKERKQNEQ